MDAISEVLAYGVGVGLSPIPLVAVILVLFSARARVNGPAFLVGWMAGLLALVTAVHVAADAVGAGSDRSTDDAISWFRVLLGLLLLGAAARKWARRPRLDVDASPPKWMSRIDGFTPPRALGLGALLAVNPKNLALALGAGMALAQLDVPARQVGAAIVVFVLVGSSLVVLAVGYALAGGSAASARLDGCRAWLVQHQNAVMAALFAVFGALLVGQGLVLRS